MSIASKLLQKMTVANKAAGLTARPDLSITDFHPIEDGRRAGYVVIAHDPHLATPTAAEIEQFFVQTFGESVQAQPHTLQVHEDVHAVSVAANLQVVTRAIQDADQGMVRINPLKYVDASTQQVWNVESDEAGRKYMVRESAESLAEVIELRRTRSRSLTREARVASSKLAQLAVDVGDRVSFYDNGILAYGEVKDFDAGMVGIEAGTGKVTVAKSAIVKVIAKGDKQVSDEKSELRKYFSEAFGDAGYAAELTNELAGQEEKKK